MCGSGTFLIEAIAKKLNIPNVVRNKYLFENWIDFQKESFLEQKSALQEKPQTNKDFINIVGCEINRDVFIQARKNIKIAGFESFINLYNDDFANLKIDGEKGVILCNPPYGKKLGDESELIELYEKIGKTLKNNFSGWEFWLLSGNSNLTQYLRMKSSLKIPVSNGGIDCRWIKYLIR